MQKNIFKTNKYVLVLICGIIWLMVSFMLFRKTIGWYNEYTLRNLVFLYLGGALVGGLKYWFMLRNFVVKNISRIYSYPDKVNVFLFLAPKSYLLIVLMIFMGRFFRNSGYFSHSFLIVLYSGISFALFLSAIKNFIISAKRPE